MSPRLLLVSLSTVLFACGPAQNAPSSLQSQQPRPVKLAQVEAPPQGDEFSFPAVVTPVKTLDLNFEVAGRLTQLDVAEGLHVRKGRVLARLDSTPFERQVADRRTRLNTAEAELARMTKMHGQGVATQRMLDSARTEYDVARLALEKAKEDLTHTVIYAPFDAQVSRRMVEPGSFIRQGEPIVRLQDRTKIYFSINVPERVISHNSNSQIQAAYAAILSRPEQEFPVTYVEHSTQQDPITQTYKFVFAMEPIPGLNLTPGLRARVRVIKAAEDIHEAWLLPLSALVADNAQGFYVWYFNPDSASVSRRDVEVVSMRGDRVLVRGALSANDAVVAAGVSQMREGLLVTPYSPEG